MKRFTYHNVALLPLLSILAMSPSVIENKFHSGRSIASVIEEVKGHPKYEALASKTRPELLMKDSNLSKLKFIEKRNALKAELQKEREEFKKEVTDDKIVQDQGKKIESLVIDTLLVEGSLKELQDKKLIDPTEEEASIKLVEESKNIIESLLTDLDSNKVLVAKGKETKIDETKKEEKPAVAEKKEEPKKEEQPVVAEKKEEPKKEEPKVCETDEQNKVLTKQVEELTRQNQQILQSMLSMTQMMMSMQQQQQQMLNPFFQNGPGWNQSPYQYHQPQSAGNWVYYPQGFQPHQANIFAQPQMPLSRPQNEPQQGAIYPDQMHQQQPMSHLPQNWSLRPDPRYQVQQYVPGAFGSEPLSFNMGNVVPTITQL